MGIALVPRDLLELLDMARKVNLLDKVRKFIKRNFLSVKFISHCRYATGYERSNMAYDATEEHCS